MERSIERLYENVCAELEKRADRGLSNTNDLEIAEKLTAIKDHIKHHEYMELKTDYYETVLESMRDGGCSGAGDPDMMMHSGRRRRDSMGRYTSGNDGSYDDGRSYGNRRDTGRPYDAYMDAKRAYRSGAKSSEDKHRMLDALDHDIEDTMRKIEDYCRDADCTEEKELIRRAVRRLNGMID